MSETASTNFPTFQHCKKTRHTHKFVHPNRPYCVALGVSEYDRYLCVARFVGFGGAVGDLESSYVAI